MKKFRAIFIILFAAILFSGSSFAQDGHYYTIQTWKLKVPPDGSFTELNNLFKEWYDKVITKSDKILSEKVLTHLSGSDGRDWVVIDEYASWNDINEAQQEQNELAEKGWSAEGELTKFYKTFNKYVITHSDEILQEKPELTK